MTPLILPFHGHTPSIHPSAFIAPGAVIIGNVTIGENASIWYGCVLRGDTNAIKIGDNSNVQDGTIIHVDDPALGGTPVLIGKNALIGHRCMLHGCTIEEEGFVGMGATVLDGAVIQTGSFLAAGAFIAPKKCVPSGEMWGGLPARKLRNLKPGEDKMALMGAAHYVEEANAHRSALKEYDKALGDAEIHPSP